MRTDQATDTPPQPPAVGAPLDRGLGPLPEADLIADPHNLGGFGTDYYAAGTVRRLLAAERERAVSVLDSLPTPSSYKASKYEEFLAWTATARRRILAA